MADECISTIERYLYELVALRRTVVGECLRNGERRLRRNSGTQMEQSYLEPGEQLAADWLELPSGIERI